VLAGKLKEKRKKGMKAFFISTAFIFTTACMQSQNNNNAADTAVVSREMATPDSAVGTLNGEWELEPLLASDTATGKIPFINFDVARKKFTGHTGCNNMSGSFFLNGDSLSFNEQIVTTKMACPGYNEQSFLESLTKTNNYKIENEVLQLYYDKTILSKWARRNSVKPKNKI